MRAGAGRAGAGRAGAAGARAAGAAGTPRVALAAVVGPLHVGQGVVVSRGTVLTVEAFEGTNQMLERAGKFGAKNCLFVKLAKPKQDTRFDVPVFGLQTLRAMKEAGIGNVAVETGSVLLLEKNEILKESQKSKIGIQGILKYKKMI